MLEIPRDWATCIQHPLFREAQEVLYGFVAEHRKKIRSQLNRPIERSLLRETGPLNIIPLLGMERGEERRAWMDVYLSGYIRIPKAPAKGQRSPVLPLPYEIPAQSEIFPLDEESSIAALDRLSDPQMMACLNFAYAARLDRTEWKYSKEAEKDNGDLYKMLRLQKKMDSLELYYRNVMDELMARMTKDEVG
jgi:hypothetical protein